MDLTEPQGAALEKLGENWKVVAASHGDPVVRSPEGELFRINIAGRAIPAVQAVRATVLDRRIDIAFPKV